MKLYIDIESEDVITSPGIPQTLSTLSFKRAGLVRIDVQFVRAGQIIELPVGSTGILELKPWAQYDAMPVSGAGLWEQTGFETETTYSFIFSLLTAELNDLLKVNQSPTDDLASIRLMGEIQWYDGAEHATQTLTVDIVNNVVRAGDVFPGDAAPVDYLIDNTDPDNPTIVIDEPSGQPMTVQ